MCPIAIKPLGLQNFEVTLKKMRCKHAVHKSAVWSGALAALALVLAAGPAFGQAWPAKPLRIVHGFGPGGPVDIIARMIGADFSEQLGQQAVVEGRPCRKPVWTRLRRGPAR